MIIIGTVLKASDNAGARLVKCIHIYNNKKFGSIGDLILVVVKTYNTKKKIKKGEMFLALIIRTKYYFKERNVYYKFSDNAAVLLNKKRLPLGTRLFGISLKYLRLINRKVYLMIPYVI